MLERALKKSMRCGRNNVIDTILAHELLKAELTEKEKAWLESLKEL